MKIIQSGFSAGLYVCMHVCMYVCMHACMYVYARCKKLTEKLLVRNASVFLVKKSDVFLVSSEIMSLLFKAERFSSC